MDFGGINYLMFYNYATVIVPLFADLFQPLYKLTLIRVRKFMHLWLNSVANAILDRIFCSPKKFGLARP